MPKIIINIICAFIPSKDLRHKLRKRFERKILFSQNELNLYYLQKTNIQASVIHPKTFLPYKGVCSNKSITIVGCGPTLSYYHEKINTVHIGCNRSFLKENINLDYLFIQDYLKGDGDMEKANAYNTSTCTKFYGIIPNKRCNELKGCLQKLTNKDIFYANAKPYILEDAINLNWANLLEIEPIGDWGGTIFSVLQFALYTNPKKLYLVGCDCSNDGHFHKEREEVYNSSSLSYQKCVWDRFKEHVSINYPDIEIISINPVGLKGMFKDVYTQSYVDAHPELLNENIEILDINKQTEV